MPNPQKVAQTSLLTIEEFSDLIITEFDGNWTKFIADAMQLTDLTTEYKTSTQGVRVPFIDEFKVLEQIGLNANPITETNVATYIRTQVKRWNKGVSCSRFQFTDAATQKLILNQVNTLVAMGAWQRSRQIATALELGDTPAFPSYDGANFFSQNHSIVSNGLTYSNLLLNNPLNAAGFNRAKTALQTIPMGEDGTFLPTETARFVAVVPPHQQMNARLTFRSSTIYETSKFADNPNTDYIVPADLKVSSLLKDPDDWYLFAIYPGLTPFLTAQQVEGAPKLIARIADTDLNVLLNNIYKWDMNLVENSIPVHPWQAVKCTNPS